jgi:hypothetical protein
MQCQWPGWSIQWAVGGIADVGGYLGFPVDKFLTHRDKSDEIRVDTRFPENNQTLLTLREDGQCRAAKICCRDDALSAGLTQVPWLQEIARASSLRWHGNMATGGFHIDIDARTLHYWFSDPAPGIEKRMNEGWPGWKTKWLGDRFEEQLRLASMDIHLSQMDVLDLQRAELQRIRTHCTHEASNLVRDLTPEDEWEQINPLTDVNRSSTGDEAEKFALLDRLEARLPIRRG